MDVNTTPTLPFGKHKDRPLAEVPSGYLGWLLRDCKLSSGLRRAVAAELSSRGLAAPALPPPAPPPTCRHCVGRRLRVTWHEQLGGRRVVRGDCAACEKFVSFLPQTPANVEAADAATPPAGLLDALTRAEEEGVELVVAHGAVVCRPAGRASPGLWALLRQAQHVLLRHLPRGVAP